MNCALNIIEKSLGEGIRGKYYYDYKKGTNLVLLSPDVAAVFEDENSVNEAFRKLIRASQKSVALKNVYFA
jgi:hypothetical protein